jgi:CRISPR/Cas system-associated exonuclease Cas4 (RecB family)
MDKIRWSYTKMKTFKECKEKYYRKYVLKEYPKENHIRYLEGNVVQNLFEHFINYNHKDLQWLLDNLPSYYQKHFNNPHAPCTFRKADSEAKFLRSMTKMVKNTYNMMKDKGLLDDNAQIKSEVHIRKDFTKKSIIQGKLDFIAYKDEELWVFDLKSRHTKYIDPLQLIFYSYLAQLRFGKIPDKVFFFASKDNKVLNLTVGEKQVKGLTGFLKKIEKVVMSSNYREMTKNQKKCWGCPHRQACWKENKKTYRTQIKHGGLEQLE